MLAHHEQEESEERVRHHLIAHPYFFIHVQLGATAALMHDARAKLEVA
jgi:hypothetical protein